VDGVRPALGALTRAEAPVRAQRVAIGVALLLGALDAWFFRNWNLNPDGVSYFDIARAVAHRGPVAALNGYWSPVYPASIGLLLKALVPDAGWMYPMVRGLNLVLYAITTFAFARLVRIAVMQSAAWHAAADRDRIATVVVLWSSYLLLVLKVIGPGLVTPDMGVAAIVFWTGAECVAIAARPQPPARFLRLGAMLAFGYWWKAILFPVAGVVLLTLTWVAYRRRDDWRAMATAWTAFALLALLLLIPVSRLVGRPTFGETGRLNQLWFVNVAPHLTHLCVGAGTRLPLDRVKAVRTQPVIAEHPLTCTLPDRWPEATLPLWYDASWWYRDTQPYLDATETTRAVQRDLVYIRDALADSAPWLAIAMGLAMLAALALRARPGPAWTLIVVGAVPVLLYLLVYVELRHVVPFLMAVAVAAVVGLLGSTTRWGRWTLYALAAVGTVDCAVRLAQPTLVTLSILRHEVVGDPRPEQLSARVADALTRAGLLPGARVATINTMWNVDWAQRGGFLVRAYTPDQTVSVVTTLQELRDPCTRQRYAAALAQERVVMSVLQQPDGFPVPDGFEPLDDTGYWILRVPPPPVATPACSAATP
jgi:hypothetical protein